MKYLKFIKISDKEHNVTNSKGDYLACIVKKRNQWRVEFDEPFRDSVVWFTRECLQQLADYITRLDSVDFEA